MCVFDRLVYALARALHDPVEAHFKTVQQVQTTHSDALSREWSSMPLIMWSICGLQKKDSG